MSAVVSGAVDGCTVELWLLSDTPAEEGVVMAVGPVQRAGAYVGDYTQLGLEAELALIQTAGSYQFLISAGAAGPLILSGDIPTTTRPYPYATGFHPLQSGTPILTQLVLTLNATSNLTRLYINSHLAQELSTPLTPLGQWFTPQSYLSFAQTAAVAGGGTWAGEVRLLAVYTGALTSDEVAVNWNASVIDPVPQPPAVEEVGWSRAEPTFGVNFTEGEGGVLVTIVGVPGWGLLEWWNGTMEMAITQVDLPLKLNGGGGGIVFTYTPADVNDSYTANITYTLSSPLLPSMSSNPGVLTFSVPPAILPPLAVNQSLNVTAQVPYLVQLTGIDQAPTTPPSPLIAYIQTLPSYGALYQCTFIGGVGASITSIQSQGSLYSGLQLVSLSDLQLRVWYVPASGLLALSERAVVGPVDAFTFRVVTQGTMSTAAGAVLLTPYNNLQASAILLVLTTNNATSVPLIGVDAVSEAIGFTVLRLPSHGQLLDEHNLSVVALQPLALPLYYVTAQDRYSGVYDRTRAPVSDSFDYAVSAPSGLLSVPATVLVTFAPALGPPSLKVQAPFDAALLVASLPAAFSVYINASGLLDGDNTTWQCVLTVSPATATLAFNSSATPSTATVTAVGPLTLGFTAETTDANALMAALLFTGLTVGVYTVSVTVANTLDLRVSASTTLQLQVTTAAGGGEGGTSASASLPFNALYLWVTVGVIVALILALITFRRCVTRRPREAVLTNEERHILQKAQGGGGGGEGVRLDEGVKVTGRGLPSSSITSGEPPSAVEMSHPTPVAGATALPTRGRALSEAPLTRGGSGVGIGGEAEDVLGGMTAVCLANVNLSEGSHLGSRLDSEMWGQFGELQQQRRGLQLVPTRMAFDPYATGIVERYEGTEPVNLHMSQTLSDTLAVSQLVVIPAVDTSDDCSTSDLSHPPTTVTAEASTFNTRLPPSVVVSGGRTRLMPLTPSGMGVTSPRLASTPSAVPGSLRDTILAPTLPIRRQRFLSRTLTLDPCDVALPQALSPRAASPAHSDRTGPRRMKSPSLSSTQSMSPRHVRGGSMGELVPVNPMIPVNVDSPRYAMDVFNRTTGERERFTPRSRGKGRWRRWGEEGGRREEGVEERMAAVVVMDHPLFQERAMAGKDTEEKE